MSLRRLAAVLGASAVAAVMFFGFSAPAQASVTPEQKLQVMSDWTQLDAGSQGAWESARADQGSWADYAFDWSTDYCSSSPDNPLGFDFDISCARHDFGYRNYKAMGQFDANKDRIDSMFYESLKRVCAGYSGASGTACNSLAWTYYQAVHVFGYTKVSQADIDRAAAMLPAGERSTGVR
ncbi:MAG: phospholipase [Actinocatenispora sp.]